MGVHLETKTEKINSNRKIKYGNESPLNLGMASTGWNFQLVCERDK